ncbi:hypothetical protein Bbelb_074060 [Branchiostoma belcheri]|nr:hypothetical protein Bbelb_074060 [Branchiostoma belcheri]
MSSGGGYNIIVVMLAWVTDYCLGEDSGQLQGYPGCQTATRARMLVSSSASLCARLLPGPVFSLQASSSAPGLAWVPECFQDRYSSQLLSSRANLDARPLPKAVFRPAPQLAAANSGIGGLWLQPTEVSIVKRQGLASRLGDVRSRSLMRAAPLSQNSRLNIHFVAELSLIEKADYRPRRSAFTECYQMSRRGLTHAQRRPDPGYYSSSVANGTLGDRPQEDASLRSKEIEPFRASYHKCTLANVYPAAAEEEGGPFRGGVSERCSVSVPYQRKTIKAALQTAEARQELPHFSKAYI